MFLFIHLSSVLSAFGMGLADQSLTLRAKASYGHDKLEKDLINKLNSNQLEFTHVYSLKSKGSDHEIDLQANSLNEAHQKFKKYYTKTFGVEYSGEILCETIAVIGKVKDNNKDVNFLKHKPQTLFGPQVISENNTAIVIEQGWQAQKNEQGIWKLNIKKRVSKRIRHYSTTDRARNFLSEVSIYC
jgi:N-methylhydantoinase A/oxoprolinase/acetone carboxylase beta subunit